MPSRHGAESVAVERTPDGRRIVVRRAVRAPESVVWKILRDTERWPEWGPSITAVESSTRMIETGTTGRVRVVGGLWVAFEITACDSNRWTWTVGRIPATGHRVEPHPDGSVVAFEIPLLAAPYVPVCSRACRRIEALALAELERSG